MKGNKEPLVSVIVPTKNSAEFLEACLKSIKAQTYKNIELIVVDNFSTDDTPKIAKKYADKFYQKGPERSAQRNYGVRKCNGLYVAIIDCDMELTSKVISSCVDVITRSVKIMGVIIPEESFGIGFWAQCKKLERSFYVGMDWIEAARFYTKETYLQVGGFNELMISGEDWDLSNRVRKIGKIAHIGDYIMHNEGKISLFKTLKKKAYYAKQIHTYIESDESLSFYTEIKNVFRRFILFFSHPIKLFKNPLYGLGMLAMKLLEYIYSMLAMINKYISRIYKKIFQNNELTYDVLKLNNNLPLVSFIIPTLNAAEYMEACLESIRKLDYPESKIEILIADGGSCDDTLKIANKYRTIILNNSKIIAEYGKAKAYKKSKGKYIIFLDADNVIASSDWLIRLLYPLEKENADFAESNYLIADDFSLVNQYASLLIIVDPLARMWASRAEIIQRKWGIYRTFKINDSPVAGANGFIWRKSVIEELYNNKDVLNEADMLNEFAKLRCISIANIPNLGIYHYYCTNLKDYNKKRRKIAGKFLNRTKEGNTWASSTPKVKKFLSIIYLATFIGPLYEAAYNFIRSKNMAWFLHPIMSFNTIFIYTLSYLKATK